MSNQQIEYALANYTKSTVEVEIKELDINDERLSRIIKLLGEIGTKNTEVAIVTQKQAMDYFIGPRWSDSDIQYPDLLQSETVELLVEIAQEIIHSLADNDNPKIQKILYNLAHAIWPLYSRHSKTDEIGFDLQEYADFFENITTGEKQQLANKIIASWDLA